MCTLNIQSISYNDLEIFNPKLAIQIEVPLKEGQKH